ncbi:uncharacterized protein PG998_011921 [Apiospora kogelbergensis]|uniref:Uncharacterized protein n=1 Tax=Apiospora kogelbergensis TaxID=1337665 RepID=A0AAW0QMH4_9PEZI
MAPPRDVLYGVVGRRRKNVYTEIQSAKAKYNKPAELQTLLETARVAVQQKWCRLETLPKRDISSNFYQWHIDRTMFEYVIRHRPFLYVPPEPDKQPYSVEWQAAYDAHQRIVPDPRVPPVAPEDRRIESAPVPDPVQEVTPGLDNVALNTGEAASALSNYTFAYEFTGSALYVMPAQTRDELWSRLFPGTYKFRGCEAFMMPFPPDRNFQDCISKSMRRINEILGHRFVRLVYGTRLDQHGNGRGRCLTFSVARQDISITDIMVLKYMHDGWYLMIQWLETLVLSPSGADVDMASFLRPRPPGGCMETIADDQWAS